jgi:bifunctional DNA-binding transcriptional regulator/antitoxin component of YhaV-PrlF toxin-antitoxin module
MPTTKLSKRGRLSLPEAVLARRGWQPGTVLSVESTPAGVLLREIGPFARMRVQDVFGSAGYTGPVRTVDEMSAVTTRLARRRRE